MKGAEHTTAGQPGCRADGVGMIYLAIGAVLFGDQVGDFSGSVGLFPCNLHPAWLGERQITNLVLYIAPTRVQSFCRLAKYSFAGGEVGK